MTKNPLWWLVKKSLINTGAAVLKSAEWLSEQEFFSNEDDEKPREDEDELEEDFDAEQDEEADDEEDDDIEDEDSEEAAQDKKNVDWDKELGLRARDQEWCDYDGPEEPDPPKIPDERADEPEPEDEEQRNEKSLAERAAGWGARKINNAINRLAITGLRYITDTDWDDDPDLELPYPSELWCKPPHDHDDDEDWEEPDEYDD